MAKTYPLEAHLFICTNKKQNKECCAEKGGEDLKNEVKNAVKKLSQDPSFNWGERLRVNASGCLGRCEEGITAVLYPQGKWFVNLQKDDTEVLVNAVKEAMKGK